MTEFNQKPSALFWVLGVLFLLWGLMGCGMYLTEVMMSDRAYEETFGQDLFAVRHVYPVWAMAAYASAVWSGLLAAILFLLRKRVSAVIFIVSLVAAIIGFIPTFTNSVLKEAAGSGYWVMPVIVVVLGALEVWYSRKQSAKGILR
jgi:hypothetical protein